MWAENLVTLSLIWRKDDRKGLAWFYNGGLFYKKQRPRYFGVSWDWFLVARGGGVGAEGGGGWFAIEHSQLRNARYCSSTS